MSMKVTRLQRNSFLPIPTTGMRENATKRFTRSYRRNGVRDQVKGEDREKEAKGRNKTWNTRFTRVFASGALTYVYDAGEPQSVYGNPREQGGLPFFLVLLLTVLGYGATPGYAVFLRFSYSARASASFSCSPRRSHILPFCTFAISAIAWHAGSRYGIARRPLVVSNDPFINDEIEENAVQRGRRRVRFRVRFSLC